MEGRPHSSSSRNSDPAVSQIGDDLVECSADLVQSFIPRPATRARAGFRTAKPVRVGVIGAGIAGLRCSQVLLAHGCEVTVLEARDRIGGRIRQVDFMGRPVDMGASWIHGTENNPLYDIAKETNTTLAVINDVTRVYNSDGKILSDDEASAGLDRVWDLYSDAFQESNEHGAEMNPQLSLRDFFIKRLANDDDKEMICLMAETWGGFIGDSWDHQSLKYFWMEECLDGDNLYVRGTHAAIVDHVAQKVRQGADIHLSTKALAIKTQIRSDSDPVSVVVTDKGDLEFDEVVVTIPLGCLKKAALSFSPRLPQSISRAFRNASYSSLEKIVIAFPAAFWDGNASHAYFIQFLQPNYLPAGRKGWPIEIVTSSSPSGPGTSGSATMVINTYGPCAAEVLGLIQSLEPSSAEYLQALEEYFQPYFEKMPNYNPSDPSCRPIAATASAWLDDELAGNGAYTNFKTCKVVGEDEHMIALDDDIRVVRKGMPERGVWFAGEHTAPFAALATTTGAYWSGEAVGMRIAAAHGHVRPHGERDRSVVQADAFDQAGARVAPKLHINGISFDPSGCSEDLDGALAGLVGSRVEQPTCSFG